jgi:hypothetical protein
MYSSRRQVEIDPGRSVRLEPGLQIDFGARLFALEPNAEPGSRDGQQNGAAELPRYRL